MTALNSDASKFTWGAAVVGSNNAAGYQLASRLPVMALGGFNGTDASPTLAQFQQLVKAGKGRASGAPSSAGSGTHSIPTMAAAT